MVYSYHFRARIRVYFDTPRSNKAKKIGFPNYADPEDARDVWSNLESNAEARASTKWESSVTGLHLVCRQINADIAKYLYSSVDFYFQSAAGFGSFLQHLKRNHMLRNQRQWPSPRPSLGQLNPILSSITTVILCLSKAEYNTFLGQEIHENEIVQVFPNIVYLAVFTESNCDKDVSMNDRRHLRFKRLEEPQVCHIYTREGR